MKTVVHKRLNEQQSYKFFAEHTPSDIWDFTYSPIHLSVILRSDHFVRFVLTNTISPAPPFTVSMGIQTGGHQATMFSSDTTPGMFTVTFSPQDMTIKKRNLSFLPLLPDLVNIVSEFASYDMLEHVFDIVRDAIKIKQTQQCKKSKNKRNRGVVAVSNAIRPVRFLLSKQQWDCWPYFSVPEC